MQKKMYCKSLVIGILVLFIGAGVYPSSGITINERPIIPTTLSNTLYVGGDGPGNYTKIQDAINDSVDGDTVFVYDDSSPYYESLGIDKSINLIGENKETTVIDGSNIHYYIVFVGANGVNINGFTIQNSKRISFFPCGGIVLGGQMTYPRDNTITGNIITSNGFAGISCAPGGYTSSNIINDNIIINNNWSIYLSDTSNNIISSNNISSNNEDGIYLGGYNNTILGNTISSNSGNGLTLWSSYNNIVTGNNISSNNNYGIWVGNSNNNIIYRNNLINNSQNANDTCDNIWDNDKSGNYWDDYTGEDNNGDGIGDTPYLIPGGDNEDRYPLMYPTCNVPPDKPDINGPTSGEPGIEYTFCINATDPNSPDGDMLHVLWDWGDGTNSGWLGPFESGVEICDSHIWNEHGNYLITATLRDAHGAIVTATLEISIPRNRIIFISAWLRIIDMFPILQRIMNYLV